MLQLAIAGLVLALALIPFAEGQLAYLYPPLENSARHAGRSVAAVNGVGSCGEAVANNSYCALQLARGGRCYLAMRVSIIFPRVCSSGK